MSQAGSSDRAAGSQPSSVAPAGARPSMAPTKMPSDDEAEEGEIVDEEEGEISQSQAAEPAPPTAQVDLTKPTDASTKLASSEERDAKPEPPAEKPLVEDNKEGGSMPASAPTALAENAPAPTPSAPSAPSAPVEPEAQIRPEKQKPEEGPKTTELTTEAPTGEPTATRHSSDKDVAAVEEPVAAEAAISSSTGADAAAEPEQATEKPPQTPQPEEPGTPRLRDKSIPVEETLASVDTPKEESALEAPGVEAPNGSAEKHDTPAAPAIPAESTAPAEETSVANQTKAQGSSDMDLDETIVQPVQQENGEDTRSGDLEPKAEPMEVEDSIHTPALPVEDLAEKASTPEVGAGKNGQTETTEEDQAPPGLQVKGEPEASKPEEQPTEASQAVEEVDAAPAEAPRQQSNEPEQRVEAGQATEAAQQPPPTENRHRSRTSKSIAEPVAPEPRHAEAPRDAASSSRLAEAEPLQTRPTSRNAAPPTSSQERRIDRSKERSHPPERSQEREQRAREKDRRRELERLERERERERERIRESERDREMMIARENEEARLIWLSLPGNDHPQYYTDTDSDSCYGASGAHGAGLTDEEDKDLDPPLPLSLQEYHPAPSYSQSHFDDQFHASKRKRTEEDGNVTSLRRHRRKPISEPERPSWSSSRQVQRDALPSTAMIDIDDFPVPDSSIRGEPSERPFSSRIERASLPRHTPYELVHDGVDDYDSSDSDEEAMRIAEERKRRHGNRSGNRGNKLSRDKGSRWVRRGKLGGWTETRMEKEIGDRVRHRVEAMQKDNVRALLSAMPDEDKAMLAQFPALRDGLIPSEAASTVRRDARGRILPSDLSEAARIDAELGLDGSSAGTSGSRLERPEHLTSTSLAPTLLKPAITPRQLLTSHTLRHTFRNPHIAALGKTALDLIESEGVLGRAVGRCWAAMERGGWNEDPEPKADALDGDETAENGMDVDASDAENAAQDAPRGLNGASSSNLFGSAIDNPALSHLDKLFVTKQGLAIPRLDDMGQPIFVPPSPSTQAARAEAGMAEDSANEAVIETTLLPAPEQRSIVLAALECLHDLAADSREYVERLEEVRSRLAAVKRRRAQVWSAVRQWALDKDIEAALSQGTRLDGMNKLAAEASGSAPASVVVAATAAANGSSPKKRK